MESRIKVALDDVSTRISMHVSRAMLVDSVRMNEEAFTDPETAKEYDLRNAMKRTVEFSEIIFDYLRVLRQEAEELRSLVDDLWESEKQNNA